MAIWRFLDYVDADGTNQIEAWLDSLQNSTDVMARLRTLLEYLQDEKALETSGYTEALTGNCSGLVAIKFRIAKVRYRPMFYRGPGDGEVTILVGAVKAGQREYDPRRACEIAIERQEIVDGDEERKHVRPHDYTER